MTRLFGTDGIRGRALEPPLDESTVRRIGAALVHVLAAGPRPRILLAGDTRASTDTLAAWIAAGFQAAGGEVTWAGVLPTPAVSHLLRRGGYAAGVVVSASHNPAEDNGIKVLAASGEKVPVAIERRLETALDTMEDRPGPPLPPRDDSLAGVYLDLLEASHGRPRPLEGLRVVVDTAHGAASGIASALLERLGARPTVIACDPDGTNINDGCGATAPQHLAAEVVRRGADAGIALDGDADRAILADERGGILDGDDILLVWARDLKAQGRLPGHRVVATVMSNLGLERALGREGIALLRCPVGDRSVWETMRESGAALGGEQSGHVICSHHAVTGDGLLTGTHVLAVAAAAGRPLSELSGLVRVPQVVHNVPVRRKPPFAEVPEIERLRDRLAAELGDRGRVLLRYSGTEPLARVMVEGDDESLIRRSARALAETIGRILG